ncbi:MULTISPECIES: GTP 3',8-cyclase MoaA [unclassified Dermacoccus]|uniref:GTP 3',8-cyclase n=1 Tax=Dermacoccus abyssi TaxID=322596 RepID=A0ABX5ZBJ3_9MICO|nr:MULTISPECIES: GTP 3',8-cyclase MoaA [unclassified Dermacoccus]MBZ4496359.1 GTP 3',8-cyclase MoaA [Dermacoccus sp. Tok2021]QEH93134.1 GTP 3',8-cyclase MoaA [Dermacoccus abyssi]RYI23860.1 GTP 3',8-cyclase MoaA [Dermacoccus sp. 147Ba]
MTHGLVDSFGRVHRDLRISLTDKCNLRCTYCMPADGVPLAPKPTLLTLEEMLTIARVAVEAGIAEIRLTGGEPLLRPDIVAIVEGLAALEGPEGHPEISMTTNGIGLARLAEPLREAGLARLNVSLDTLDPERFKTMTRRGRFDDVMAGLDAARATGFEPIKVNTVLLRGENDDEANDLLEWAIREGYELRFIEQMPLDGGHIWSRTEMITGAEILDALRAHHTLTEVPGRGAAPAELFEVDGGPARVGVVASVTMPFCGACDRLRLTSDGQLRSCLFSRTETNLRDILRSGASDDDITAKIHECLASKLPGHGINEPGFLQPPRPMSAIGG